MLSICCIFLEDTTGFWKVWSFDFSWPTDIVPSWNICPPVS